MRLVTFEAVTEEEEGRIFMEMVVAYYDVGVETEDPAGLAERGEYPRRFVEGGMSVDENAALRALVKIQAIDASERQPSPAVLETWDAKSYWDHLTLRSRYAFLAVHAES